MGFVSVRINTTHLSLSPSRARRAERTRKDKCLLELLNASVYASWLIANAEGARKISCVRPGFDTKEIECELEEKESGLPELQLEIGQADFYFPINTGYNKI